MPVAVWRELIDRYYPGSGWIAVRTETLDALLRRKAARALPTPRRLRGGSCWRSARERRARAPRRLAALRGLRALPVHAGRDQERHAHAVRDRLPARLRRRRRATFDHLRDGVPGRGAGRRDRRGRGALPAGQRPAPPGRRAARGPAARVAGRTGRAARRASTKRFDAEESPPLRVACDWAPRRPGRGHALRFEVANLTDAPAELERGGGAAPLAALHPPDPARAGRALRLAAGGGPRLRRA